MTWHCRFCRLDPHLSGSPGHSDDILSTQHILTSAKRLCPCNTPMQYVCLVVLSNTEAPKAAGRAEGGRRMQLRDCNDAVSLTKLTRPVLVIPGTLDLNGAFSWVGGWLGFAGGTADAWGLNAKMLLKGSSRKSVNGASPCRHHIINTPFDE